MFSLNSDFLAGFEAAGIKTEFQWFVTPPAMKKIPFSQICFIMNMTALHFFHEQIFRFRTRIAVNGSTVNMHNARIDSEPMDSAVSTFAHILDAYLVIQESQSIQPVGFIAPLPFTGAQKRAIHRDNRTCR